MADQEDGDPFDAILSLEDQYYAEGHALGVKDGSKAGRTEGRLFGMQKGFEKFSIMGTLAAQAALWEARMNKSEGPGPAAVPQSDRLKKHVATLAELTDYNSLDTNNTEDAVADYDDTLKRAEGKAKVISSILGEQNRNSAQAHEKASTPSKAKKDKQNDNMEDFALPKHLQR
ncbi:hypothetical protein ANO11243_077570 [Dothideomycetidae sp. 11243]|nr:hypothetical protein ANO11243_077570 [fungal sp. No.11243]